MLGVGDLLELGKEHRGQVAGGAGPAGALLGVRGDADRVGHVIPMVEGSPARHQAAGDRYAGDGSRRRNGL